MLLGGMLNAAAYSMHGAARGNISRYVYCVYKVQQFRCYRSGPRRLLGEYGGIEADRQTTSSRQQAAADS